MKQFIVKEIPKTNLEISNFEMQEVDIPKPSSDEPAARIFTLVNDN